MQKSKVQNLGIICLVIAVAVVLRVIPHPANVVPIAAMALFGGATLDRKYALVIPLLALFISDLFLGFYGSMVFVYGSFILIGFIGMWLKNHCRVQTVIAGTLVSSILFFLITNFGVWAEGALYPKTVQGLLHAYVMGIPFFRNTLIGDMFYTGLFFGTYALIKKVAVRFAF